MNEVDADDLDVIVGTWAALEDTTREPFAVIAVEGKSLRGSAGAAAGAGIFSLR